MDGKQKYVNKINKKSDYFIDAYRLSPKLRKLTTLLLSNQRHIAQKFKNNTSFSLYATHAANVYFLFIFQDFGFSILNTAIGC